MKKPALNDKEILWLAAGALALTGVLARVSRKVFRPGFSGQSASKPRKHSYLKLPKETLHDYLKGGGKNIKFEFTDDHGRVKLNFIGLTIDNREFIRKQMKLMSLEDRSLVNTDFGIFTNNDRDQSLHDLIAQGPVDELKDWFLKPVECTVAKGYVSYELSDSDPCQAPAPQLLAYKINPCPPCD